MLFVIIVAILVFLISIAEFFYFGHETTAFFLLAADYLFLKLAGAAAPVAKL